MKQQVVLKSLNDDSERVVFESDSRKDVKMMVGLYRKQYPAYFIFKRKKKSYHPPGPR